MLPNLYKIETQFNISKTEKYNISSKSGDDWKQCKYLGSYLDTDSDILRRKQLSYAAFNQLKTKLTSRKLSLKVRMRLFNVYVTSIFLYNSELWTITKKIENTIDVFHRLLLRNILGRHYPNNISNIDLYRITKETSWTEVIRLRRLRWLGHMLRLDIDTPCNLALKFYKKECW